MSIFRRNPATKALLAPEPALNDTVTELAEQCAAAKASAPRLTDKLLTKDLPELLRVAVDEIEYLDSRINATGTNAVNARLIEGFKARRESLQRSHDWLAGKIAAETGRRGGEA